MHYFIHSKPTKNGLTLLVMSLVICCFFHYSPTLANTLFKWTDSEGQTHFTDNLEKVPIEYRDQITKREMGPKTLPREPAQKKSIPVSNDKIDVSVEVKEVEPETVYIPYESRERMQSRIIVDVTFNDDVTVPMLFDTGAPDVVISAKLAGQLGLIDAERSNLMVNISGIGGEQFAFRTIVDKISMGDISEEFIPVYIVHEMADSFEGLIGLNFMTSYDITIDSINERLAVKPNPSVSSLPAGRNKLWWQRTFKEFRGYKELWITHSELIKSGKGPYAGLSSSTLETYYEYVDDQLKVAEAMFNKLNQFARFRAVPMKWRE